MPAPVGVADVPVWVTVPPVLGFGLGEAPVVVEVGAITGLFWAEQPLTSAAPAAAAIEKNRRRAAMTWSTGSSMSTRRILPYPQLQHATNRDGIETESADSTDAGRRAGRITGMSTGGGR